MARMHPTLPLMSVWRRSWAGRCGVCRRVPQARTAARSSCACFQIEEQDPEALGKPAGTRAVQVPAGQAVEVGVACGAAGDTVEWSYSVEAHNINFTLLWRDLNPDGPSPVESDATALREVGRGLDVSRARCCCGCAHSCTGASRAAQVRGRGHV